MPHITYRHHAIYLGFFEQNCTFLSTNRRLAIGRKLIWRLLNSSRTSIPYWIGSIFLEMDERIHPELMWQPTSVVMLCNTSRMYIMPTTTPYSRACPSMHVIRQFLSIVSITIMCLDHIAVWLYHLHILFWHPKSYLWLDQSIGVRSWYRQVWHPIWFLRNIKTTNDLNEIIWPNLSISPWLLPRVVHHTTRLIHQSSNDVSLYQTVRAVPYCL